eukprot:CAMPEP_0197847870 /NCGR_PEP_ID=MMETSP1438-20131217/7361_1 /TAXON_ID=1461541 /ORGANISM="Pterosperma sp., Strain CCMP1384" /LENGTH=444 /DNA_ID=CAMNT_0043459929 /DNA_START=188 /DNA_END=1523 /DNA_ORIENTATION=-
MQASLAQQCPAQPLNISNNSKRKALKSIGSRSSFATSKTLTSDRLCASRPRSVILSNRRPLSADVACASTSEMPSGLSSILPENTVYENVTNYYGKVLSTSKDLKTSACTAAGRPPEYVRQLLKAVPKEVKDKFYGCGVPLPSGIEGLRVLDLGSGSGRDCFVAAALVGENGSVVGVDMTDEQLEVARKHGPAYCTETLGYKENNMKYIKGHIEYLDKAGIEDESVDVIISNCVVNLSPDKKRVLSEAYRVLEAGGEFYFSDVYCDRRLPQEVVEDEVLFGECISGALYVQDFIRYCRDVGFTDPRVLSTSKIEINDPELKRKTGEAQFYSITYRLFKLPDHLETLCEDYGQVAVYKGTIPGSESAYQLDDHHRFVKGKPMLVCGNTGAMVGEEGLVGSPSTSQSLGIDQFITAFLTVVGSQSLINPQAIPQVEARVARPTSGG